jgi:hypothetical protein
MSGDQSRASSSRTHNNSRSLAISTMLIADRTAPISSHGALDLLEMMLIDWFHHELPNAIVQSALG